jgi:tetratricopeptide (TPR) repeat protein
VIALSSRLFPALFPEWGLSHFLPGAATRLNFPLGYWNGLGVMLGMAVPLLLRSALVARSTLVRSLPVAALPAFSAGVFLTSSRAGVGAVLLGTFLFLVLVQRRVEALAAVAVGAAGSAAALAVLLVRNELVNGPLDAAVVAAQGRSAALLVALVCVATGLVYAAALALGRRAPQPGRRAELAALAAVLAVAVAGVVLADPAARFEQLQAPPDPALEANPDYVREHLLRGTGNGRWQLWTSAVDQFRQAPLHGQGAGSFEAWWAQHGTLPLFVRDAHSLYLETLGELGAVGFLLLAGAFAAAVGAGVLRLRRTPGDGRVTLAALFAAFGAFAFGAAFDWMWELTIVALLGAVLLGLLTGRGTAPPPGDGAPERDADRSSPLPLRLGVAAIALTLALAGAVPLLVTVQVRASQEAFARGDLAAARSSAVAARTLQPWAASPHLQLALVDEAAGRTEAARASIERAIDRHPSDWRLWLVAARIETKAGRIPEARERLERAMELSPRSSVFADVAPPSG